MKRLSLPQDAIQDPAYRLLMEKRCEVYNKTAGLLMEVEEALDQEDLERGRLLLDDVRKALRGSLAFLTDEVYEELEHLESLAGLANQAMPAGSTSNEDLRDALTLLHVKLARSLRLPGQDLADIVGLPPRLKRKLEESQKKLEEGKKRRDLEEQTWNYEAVARELIGAKQYKKAVKHLKQAIRLDPDRAVFHNDLGVVYGLLGLHEEAASEYRKAVELNEKHADRRTDEWTTSYHNLGIALRKLAAEYDAPGQESKALAIVREAKAALDEYVKVTPGGPKVAIARKASTQLAEDALILETAIAKRAEDEDAPPRWHAGDE
ncbi:MAG TPA: tetratricopeptide repeat protein [Planctomycetota bacterium]|nr:tetratricopeptide repeat protein [Planctomycetota bacterium]